MRTFLPSFCLFILSLSSFFLSLQASPDKRDTQLLISFKGSVSDASLLHNWQPNQDPCQFSGISCQESRVSSIDLSSIPLSTDFQFVARYLLVLEKLESLSLVSSNISGTISFPRGFKCSSVLGSLDLANNSLSGPVSSLSYLGSCSNLTSLNLSSNSLDFSGKKSKGLLLGFEVLDLSYNKISSANVVSWVVYGGCNDLRHLVLKGNKIAGEIDVSGCKNLQVLDVSSNNFSSGVPLLGDCLTLEHLDISSNKFSGDISRAISPCTHLNFLNISYNQFMGPIPALPASSNLQYLYLSGNHFIGEIPLHLSDFCSSLVLLDLSYNNLTGTIPSGFGSCSSLESFDVSSNLLSGELPLETILQMANLKELVLSSNNFSSALPESLSNLTTLETLDLSSNSLTGSIPVSLCQNPRNNLKVLLLQNNMLTGPIPASLSNCSQLVSLHLSFNYLTGTIPASLGSLSKLRDLKLWLNQLHGDIPPELSNIQTLETLILDFNDLTGTIPSGLSNCTKLNWIALSNNHLTGQIPAWIGKLSNLAILKLSNNSFYGNIPQELGDCQSLIWLDLNTNALSGTIPPVLFKQSGKIAVNFISGKRFMYAKNDGSKECHGAGNLLEFAGIRAEQLTRISARNPCNFTTRVYGGHTQPTFNNNGSMIFLDLSYNKLSGSIPVEIGTMPYLYILNLGHNNISGSIPEEIGSLMSLGILDLSYNMLEGTIPQSLTHLAWLIEIHLSNNHLTGSIPEMGQLETFSPYDFENNTGLCGYPLSHCGGDPASRTQHHKSQGRQASLAGSIAMGLLFSLFCIFGLIIVTVGAKKRREKKDSALNVYIENNSHSGTATTNWKIAGAREALSINLATFEKPLMKLTFADLVEATNCFHSDSLIGSGGFGDVYKAQLRDGSVVAIKKLKYISGQGDREFTAEMETIGKIKHQNLVPLLGYCRVGEERLLVYEYMKYGSLDDVLHDQKKAGKKLNWATRRKIALGTARGLVFLHHNCIPHIIHRDLKSSNVLLDENLEARVSDFGMARLMSAMDTHLSVSTLAGTPGYVPPEYSYQIFRCSTKGDVYSYGVVLLELLTGKRPTDSAYFGDNNLVGWVKQHAKTRVSDVFDPELLKEDPTLEFELLQHLKVASACLDDRPSRRPTMIQVMAMFNEIQTGSGLDSHSTTATDDGGFSAVEMADMTIKERP